LLAEAVEELTDYEIFKFWQEGKILSSKVELHSKNTTAGTVRGKALLTKS